MSRNSAEGDLIVSPVGALITYFTTSSSAPSTSDLIGAHGTPLVGQVAAGTSGASTGAIYHFNGSAWVDTGSVVKAFYGGTT